MPIKLRKFKLSDANNLHKLFANDKVLKNLSGNMKAKKITIEQEKDYIKNTISNYKPRNPKVYHLAITINNKIIGSIGAHKINYKTLEAEIGYWIGENYWGKGYATKAIKQISKRLFNKFNLKKIKASPFSSNKASQKALEKAGFKFEKERKKAIKKGKKLLNDKIYSILKCL